VLGCIEKPYIIGMIDGEFRFVALCEEMSWVEFVSLSGLAHKKVLRFKFIGMNGKDG